MYLSAEAREQVRAAQARLDEHPVSGASDLCLACGVQGPCPQRRAEEHIRGGHRVQVPAQVLWQRRCQDQRVKVAGVVGNNDAGRGDRPVFLIVNRQTVEQAHPPAQRLRQRSAEQVAGCLVERGQRSEVKGRSFLLISDL